MVLGLIIIAIVVVFIVGCISISNHIKQLNVKCEEASASIEVALVKRYDVLQSSYDVVKGFTKHENEILTELIQVRKGMTISDMSKVAESQEKSMKGLFALAEQYPILKSDTVYANLQKQLTEENTHFAAAKRVFNSNVSAYNQYIVAFPASVIAGMTDAKERDFFKEPDVDAKRDVKFEF